MDKSTRPRQPERMVMKMPRIAVRALILQEDRLLLVNAYAGAGRGPSDLWCAPGGGVNAGTSLPENLMREVMEETGLTISVGTPALINEFHEPKSGFHQVEVFFHCWVTAGVIDTPWQDPEGVVTERRWCTRAELAQMRFKPDSLPQAAWGTVPIYDALELIVP